jgi:predicted lipid carrier protein YhbT
MKQFTTLFFFVLLPILFNKNSVSFFLSVKNAVDALATIKELLPKMLETNSSQHAKIVQFVSLTVEKS